jgi:putative two-component system response regulator
VVAARSSLSKVHSLVSNMNTRLAEFPKTTPADRKTATAAVLFVDDYEAMRTFVKAVLERNGYRCTAAANSAEARKCLGEQMFDLAVLDVTMPGESGLSLAKSIRTDYPHTAVMMATAIDDLRTADSALKAGVYGYLVKPFEANQLLINVAGVLDRRRLERESQQQRNELKRLVRTRTLHVRDSLHTFCARPMFAGRD